MTRDFVALTAFVALTIVAPAAAQEVSGLGDLVGARGSSADDALAQRGYNSVNKIGGAVMYWNATTRICASVAIDQGRVQSIQRASAAQCNQSGGGGETGGRAALAQMPRICKGAAAEKFGQRPQDISTQMPVSDQGMYSVFGQFPPNGAGTVFICTFTRDGKLVGVDRE